MRFTDEQLAAIERREGDLLLDAGAGSGKTSVLVERFVRAVREDGVEVGRILAITFTEKAAAELRERIRARLRELGSEAEARETEGAFISTIHGFCARLLRIHALEAGLDPSFVVLEAQEAQELAGAAFDAALADAARGPGGSELIATHGAFALRAGILAVYGELRSRGQLRPQLPPVAPADVCPGGAARPGPQAAAPAPTAARAASAELAALPDPGIRITQALDVLERVETVLAAAELWPGDLDAVALGNGAGALKSETCEHYRDALASLRAAAAASLAGPVRDALNDLLVGYGERYAELKRGRSGVDFEDLELLARELLRRPEIGSRYRERFAHVMVDELQDTNRVQLDLVDLVSGGAALFMVGDAQQSIYGFRHADVELFEERGRELAARGARASLQTNFRSRPEILSALNPAFELALGEGFRPLVAGRPAVAGRQAVTGRPAVDPPPSDPLVEMLIVDKGADWEDDGLAAPWRVAEARTLAARVAELIGESDWQAGDVVVLTRATTDLRAYERALEEAGVPTYVIGGRGYWAHPQVVEMVGYLRALANPRDEEAWYGTLVSPLCGLSLDGLVLVAAGARDELGAADAERLVAFESWFAEERVAATRMGAEDLIDRVMERTGYDAHVLGLPGGRRRLANVRKLMRLGREWEARAGFDLRGFLGFVEQRAAGAGRESEAPVESEGLDAVRLMTIHRAKGLEFPVVCVADLGRGPNWRTDLIRIGRDGRRLGLRLGRPGSGPRVNALDYEELGREQRAAEDAEERRLFYVAMTRAQERLVLSGAARLDAWERGNAGPIGWIGPAFAPDIAERSSEGSFLTEHGVEITFVSEEVMHLTRAISALDASPPADGQGKAPIPPPAPPSPPVSSLSYSSLALYERCGYRFYTERVLGLPPAPSAAPAATAGLSPTDRGTAVHALLQALDLNRPEIPPDTPPEVAELVRAFIASPTRARLAAATDLRREQPFAFPLGPLLVTGAFDALARGAEDGTLVVDYKTDRLEGTDPAAATAAAYGTQRLVYALAALRAGAHQVEVVHLFLEAPDRPVSASFIATDAERLTAELARRAEPLLAGHFEVTATPQRSICAGCPAQGGLCSWPLELTTRSAADRLF